MSYPYYKTYAYINAAIAKVSALERDPKNKDIPASVFEHARKFISYIYDKVEGLIEALDRYADGNGIVVTPLTNGIDLLMVCVDKNYNGMLNMINVEIDQSGRILLHDLHKTFDMRDEALLTCLKSFL